MVRPVTLADVARLARVSPKTVSNVLAGKPHVSPSTREAVEAAVAALQYRPHMGGRSLASGRTGRIAVVVPNLYQPYFAELAERLIVAVEHIGLTTTLRLAPDANAERDALIGVTTSDADALLVCPHFSPRVLLDGQRPGRPIIQVGGPGDDEIDCVVMGEYRGAADITEHLLALGRRQIAIVWNGAPHEGDRYRGVVDTLRAHGIEADELPFVVGSDWDRRESGYEAVTGLLRGGREIDALLCANDATAIGALRALRVRGVRVPDDVAVTGFDDTDESRFTLPPLTSVSPEQDAMVAAAIEMLQARLAGDQGPARRVGTGAHVVARASTLGH
ncbi:LacI family DNA-binding transcriptional regulator [Pseudactinotalea sp.]|uniref:LacI family DNA-binding transcriptional regulator n=1 Tax=Pseudactinotalea sp. TaxID=1926260 RepID=UPI003B3A4ACD